MGWGWGGCDKKNGGVGDIKTKNNSSFPGYIIYEYIHYRGGGITKTWTVDRGHQNKQKWIQEGKDHLSKQHRFKPPMIMSD